MDEPIKPIRHFAQVLPRHHAPDQKQIIVQAGVAALTHWNNNPELRERLDNSLDVYQMFVLHALQRATNERLEPALCMAFGLNDKDFVPKRNPADKPKGLTTEAS